VEWLAGKLLREGHLTFRELRDVIGDSAPLTIGNRQVMKLRRSARNRMASSFFAKLLDDAEKTVR
jgi:hypothetical protein